MLATKFSNCNQHARYTNSAQMHSLFSFLTVLTECLQKKNLNKTIINCAKCPFPQYLHLYLIYTVITTDVRVAVITLNYKNYIHKSKKIHN